MDKHTFKASIVPLIEFFNQEPTKDMLSVYYSVLGEYDVNVLNACISEAYANSKWLPKPAEIKEIANRLTYVNIFDAIDSDNDALLDNSIKRLK